MKDESISNFGLLIAYLLPGCVALWGLGQASPSVGAWLGSASSGSPTLGGFLYVTLAAIGAGLTASTVRWIVIDALHHNTGITPPRWDFSRLGDRIEAYGLLVDSHYRYYQFYANTLVASAFAYGSWRLSQAGDGLEWSLGDAGFVLLWPVFFAGSRDTLRKFYVRVETLVE